MHKTKSFEQVVVDHPEYYVWCKTQPKPPINLKEFLDWVEMQYDVDFQHEAPGHGQTRFVVNREMPEEHKPSPKKGKANARNLQYPFHQQPCAEGCSNLSRMGQRRYA